MPHTYSPCASRVLSGWEYPFPLPSEKLARRDMRALRTSAINDRARLLSLAAGELTPTLQQYQAGIHEGQNLVYEKFVEHASPIQKRLVAAQATIEKPPPNGESDAGAGDLRAAHEARAARRQHIEDVTRSEEVVRVCRTELAVIAQLAHRAYDHWSTYGERLFAQHYETAFGARPLGVPMAILCSFVPTIGIFASPSLEISTAEAHPRLVSANPQSSTPTTQEEN